MDGAGTSATPARPGAVGALLGAGLADGWTALAAVGAVATTVAPDDLVPSLDRALAMVAGLVGAVDAEIFLTDPACGRLVLTSAWGEDADAFEERCTFEPGRGFPGMAAAERSPVTTADLARDQRFLRQAPKREGLHGFAAFPLLGATGAVGTLDVAWRSGLPDAGALDFLARVTPVIACAVRAGLTGMRERIHAQVMGASLARALEVLRVAIGARAMTAVLGPPEHSAQLTVGERARSPHPLTVLGCPRLAAGHATRVTSACRRCGAPDPARLGYCVPLTTRELRGGVIVDFDPRSSRPPTRAVVPLLIMTRAIADAPLAGQRAASAPPPCSRLELRCLGSFAVLRDGRPVPREQFGRRKALTLLALLALRAGNPIHRDALIELLWPGVDSRAGGNRLHVIVHALRTAIDPAPGARSWSYVVNRGELYAFNTEAPHTIDVHRFRHLEAEAAGAVERGDPAHATSLLGEAIELYQGELFADDPYAEWCAGEREGLRQRFLEMVRRLADLRLAAGDGDSAVGCLRRGLAVDPYREDLHQLLIETLAGLGRRGEAHACYEACIRLLRDELGVEPLAATLRLRQRVASG